MIPRSKLLRVPRGYQDEAIDFICDNPFVGLFIDMGLGKTMIMLHAFLELPKPIVLVGPIRVIESVWQKEASEWLATRNLSFTLYRGSPKQREALVEEESDVFLVNPELLDELLENGPPFRTLAIDESTLYKNPSAKRFKSLRRYLKQFERRIIATGTPAPNSLMDLWSQVFLLDRGEALDSAFGRFQRKFFYTTDWQGYKFAPHDWARDEILENISHLIYRMSADALPPREVLHNVINLTLPVKARAKYDEMEAEAFYTIAGDDTITAATAAAKAMKLRQIAGGFIYDEDQKVHWIHKAKIDATREILEGTGSPVIVVYQFKPELAILQKEFPQGVMWDPKLQDDWDAGKIPLLFLHPQSGGHGLNLQYGCHTMVIYSGSFSLEQMDQVRGRIDRSGQEHPVVFHYLAVENSVDNLILEVLNTRAEDQSQVLAIIKRYADEFAKNRDRRGAGRRREVDPHQVPGPRAGPGGNPHRRPSFKRLRSKG